MGKGIEIFREHFSKFTDYFILIGGTACELTLANSIGFRTTKDIDILVLLEKIDRMFAQQFHQFVTVGQYSCYISKDDNRHFYRFHSPKNDSYPSQIELLSRALFPEYPDMRYTPLSEDAYVKSMSAIILGTEYYEYALRHHVIRQDLPCLDIDALIVFKAAAYLNLREQKEKDIQSVRSDEMNKHRNDVFRLLSIVAPSTIEDIPSAIKENLQHFIEMFPPDTREWEAIRQSLRTVADTPENYLQRFKSHFGLK